MDKEPVSTSFITFYSVNVKCFHVMNLTSSSLYYREDWEKMHLGSECFIINNYNELCAKFFPLNSFSFFQSTEKN